MYNSRSTEAGNCILGWIFLPREDLCLQPQLFKIAVSRACNEMALTPCSGDTCQALLVEQPARGHTAKNQSGFGLPPKFFISLFLCPFQDHRSTEQIAPGSAGVWCWAS